MDEVVTKHLKFKNLTTEEVDLYELSCLAGITWNTQVFKIILELLRLKTCPMAVEKVLKMMAAENKANEERKK